MTLQKRSVAFNFSNGVNTKSDPYQVPFGEFLSLENMTFQKGGRLTKRNGMGFFPSPTSAPSTLTTFNNSLVGIGTALESYVPSNQSYINQGPIQPVSLNTVPIVRTNTSQTQVDSAVAPNGIACIVFTDQNPSNLTHTLYKYGIYDSVTGQTVVVPTTITLADTTTNTGTPRVFLIQDQGGYSFVIVYSRLVSSGPNVYNLQYFTISANNPSYVTSPITLTTSYAPAPTGNGLAFDGASSGSQLFLAWQGAAASGLYMAIISNNRVTDYYLVVSNAALDAYTVSVSISPSNLVFVTYYYFTATSIVSLAVDFTLATIIAPTVLESIAFIGFENITSTALDDNLFVFFDLQATIFSLKATITGSTLTPPVGPIVLSAQIGLSSKSIYINGNIYLLCSSQSTYQSTYFLVQATVLDQLVRAPALLLAKLAYGNGAGFPTHGLTAISINDGIVSIAYLFKDSVQPVNKSTNVTGTAQSPFSPSGLYSQLGINLVNFNITPSDFVTTQIANNLNISGGFLWSYDGQEATENGFFLWPEPVQVTGLNDFAKNCTVTDLSTTVTTTSGATAAMVGLTISGTEIVTGTTVVSITDSSTFEISQAATGTATGSYNFTGGLTDTSPVYYYVATYAYTDNAGNYFESSGSIPVSKQLSSGQSRISISVPCLSLTYKYQNPIKIRIYRWSTTQQVYYEVTSITTPLLNTPLSSATVSFIDYQTDEQILGNQILYTTGGVIENISPPSFSSIFLFDDRLWGIDSENPNLLWFSKQVIQATSLSMSDLLTYYVAPNVGAQGPTGPILCGQAMDDKLILFKKSAINYVAGTGPDNTGANSQYTQPIFIASTIGCSNQRSIVFIPNGLMFEFSGESGNQIWLLGRDLSTNYIGAPVEELTRNASVLSSINIAGTNQVRFMMDSGVTLVFDYYYGKWSTWSVSGVSSCLYEGEHTFVDDQGQIYQETPGVYLDGGNPVLMSFTSAWTNLGGLQGYQRAYFLTLLGTYHSPHKLNIELAYDYDPSTVSQTLVVPNNFSPTFGSDLTFGSSAVYGGSTQLEAARIFFTKQRCEAFQLKLTELYDPSYGVQPAQGLSLSGVNLVVGAKSGTRPFRADQSVGTS